MGEEKKQDLQDVNARFAAAARQVYDHAASTHGAGSRAVLLNRPSRQQLRFFELAKFVDLSRGGVRLLDVGCGNAELYAFLAGLGYRGEYHGIDVNASLLAQARERFAGIHVRAVDIMEQPLDETYDYVVMSTVFNLFHGQTQEWINEFLRRMFRMTKHLLAFNALSTYVNFRDPEFYYLDPAEMLRFCIQELSPRVVLAHHQVSYNYTVAVYRAADTLACEA
jgi:SAM-dependent methyltransferase